VSITFRCQCGAVHTVDESQVGVLFHCEACGLDLPVPPASTVPDAAPGATLAGQACRGLTAGGPVPAPGATGGPGLRSLGEGGLPASAAPAPGSEPAPAGAPPPESDAAESFARLIQEEHPHADAGELVEIVDPGHVHAHAKEELATVAHEVDPAHQGSAADLVAQMRAARAGIPAAALGDLAAGPRPAARLARPRTMTVHQRASHHIGFKRFMWKPVLVMGVVCALFGLYCVLRLVMSGRAPAPPPRPAGLPEGFSGQPLITSQGRPIKDAQGRDLFVGGKIVKDEKGQEIFVKLSVPEKKRILRDSRGEPWLVDLDADAVTWQGDKPTATAGGFDIPVTRAEEDEDFAEFLDAEHPQRHAPSQSLGYLGFAAAFLAVSPALVVLAVWMRRHVALVAEAGPAPGAPGGPVPAPGAPGGLSASAAPAPGTEPASGAALEPEIIDAELADAPESPGATGGLPASAPPEPDSEPTPKDPPPAD